MTEELETIIEPTAIKSRIPDGKDGVEAIAALAAKASGVQLRRVETAGLGDGLPDKVPLIFDLRPGGKVEGLKGLIEAHRLRPERRTGTASVNTLARFIDLTNRHKDEHSAIFAETAWPKPALQAVLDYHQIDGMPRHGDHRVRYEFPLTDEFKVWAKMNSTAMEQSEFAAFLEEHAAELAAPYDAERSEYERLFKERFATPADLIALSRSLEVFVGARVKRSERLSSGERTVEFVEEHTNTKGEKVDIPGIFMVSMAAFIDSEPVRIPCRLRYRISGGGIAWFYQMYRWEQALRDRVQNDLAQAARETGLPTFEGKPEA